jgi:hypothetical protein
MALSSLLPLLASNNTVTITLVSKTGDVIIKFNAPGWEAIESDLGAYLVTSIAVNTKTDIGIVIEENENV